jgi:HK97 family phage major capsid protein
MKIQEIREARGAKSREMQAMVAAKGREKWTAADTARFNTLEIECAHLDEEVDRMQRTMDAVGRAHVTGQSNLGDLADNPAAVSALGAFAVRGDRAGFGIHAALTEGADSGGVLVPYELSSEILAVAKKHDPLRAIARVVNAATAASKFTQPVIVGGAPVGWVGETDARPATDAPEISGVEFPDAEVYVNVPITSWLEEDTQAGRIVVEEIGKAFGRAEGQAFITGGGSKQPFGFLNGTPADDADADRDFGVLQYVPTGVSGVVTADSLISLLYTLLPEYRTNAAWVMNSTTVAAIRKLKSTSGDYVWADSLLPGQPATLLGYPVVECNHMPDIGADAFPVALGDFKSGYTIVDRTMVMLRDPYTNKPYVNIYARKRVSGNVVDSCAIKLLKASAT